MKIHNNDTPVGVNGVKYMARAMLRNLHAFAVVRASVGRCSPGEYSDIDAYMRHDA